MPTKKPKLGRPPLPKGQVRGKITPIRLQDDERVTFEKAAEKAGLSLSEWMRRSLRLAAEQQ